VADYDCIKGGETMSLRKVIERCRVRPGTTVCLKDYDPAWTGEEKESKAVAKKDARSALSEDLKKLAEAQDLLYAANSWSVLIILQAMDAAGKDSTIKHVMSGVNPQGCQVYSFKHPSDEELEHDFLWRCARVLPERGRIGIFNRSYYEEVLIVKVHPELLHYEHLPQADPEDKKFWKGRYKDINGFERHLVRSGTLILKFFLHLSREEQRRRFLERVNDPAKHWKFAPSDLAERALWDEYTRAYEGMLTATSTKWAPWYVIPADHKWATRVLVANIVVSSIHALDLSYPELTPDKREQLKEARRLLEDEAPLS
jgi:PPK2 family polyphosphate:nucleotide phosphotransferase